LFHTDEILENLYQNEQYTPNYLHNTKKTICIRQIDLPNWLIPQRQRTAILLSAQPKYKNEAAKTTAIAANNSLWVNN
jgi:hypothetical protein